MSDIDDIRDHLSKHGLPTGPAEVGAAMRAVGMLVTDATVLSTLEALRRDSEGVGILEPLLALPGVTDVVVNGPGAIYYDCGEGLRRSDVRFADEADLRRFATRLAATAGRRLDDSSPFVDARLKSGGRFHAILGGRTDCGTCLSLRVPQARRLGLDEWVGGGSMSRQCAAIVSALVDSRQSFLVSGGTGSGKTTLLATLLGLADPSERLLIVEDSRELDPGNPHTLRLEARPPNAEGRGSVPMSDLVKQALRMRPDRLVVGEVRGAEITDLLMALNTGHEGGCGTVHANSAADVPARLEALAALGGMGRLALHAQLASALKVFIHIRRLGPGVRWVAELNVLDIDPAGLCRAVPAARFDPSAGMVRETGFALLEGLLR
ncbi:MAG: TadA family conjugal transfer-associated ATPase [Propionibacteriaceae bacterium]|jgi:pilus assembly protein CpaF|nr:TadA family conjugal transfer-associated ATPase [Propionibacteriaceae bacterium]